MRMDPMPREGDNAGLNLDTLRDVILERMAVLALVPAVCLAVSVLVLFVYEKPEYESASTLYLMPYVSVSGEIDYNSQQANAKLVKNILSLAVQDTVLESVGEVSGIRDMKKLRGMLKVENEAGTELIRITASSHDPALSQLLAEETASSLMRELEETMHMKNIAVVSAAACSKRPVWAGKLRRTAYFLSAGFITDMAMVIWLYFREKGYHSAAAIEAELRLPVLAELGKDDEETCTKVRMRLREMKDTLLYPLPNSHMYGLAARYGLHDRLVDTDMFYTDEEARRKIRNSGRAVILIGTETDRKEIRMFIRDLKLNGIETAGIILARRGQEGLWR